MLGFRRPLARSAPLGRGTFHLVGLIGVKGNLEGATVKRSRVRAGSIAFLLASLGAAGCGGGSASSPTVTPTTRPTGTPTPKPTATPTPTATPSTTPAPEVSGHLYVALTVSNTPTVQRYPIAQGVPEQPHDLVYSGVTWPITVDSSGNLYATHSGSTVNIYQYGSATPSRVLDLRSQTLTSSTQRRFFVGPRGDLYVGYDASAGSVIQTGVLVYGPGASGAAPPVERIVTGQSNDSNGAGFVGGVILDKSGNLILTENFAPLTSYVYTYALPATKPRLLRTLSGPGIVTPAGLAIDSLGELYVVNNEPQTFIAAYPTTASGNPAPDRKITVAGYPAFGYGIATAGGVMFVANLRSNSVDEIYAGIGGQQTPISALDAAYNPLDVKLGK